MVMPPPSIGDNPYNPDSEDLQENLFHLGGTSAAYLAPFRVFDDRSEKPCRIEVLTSTRTVIADQWRDHPEPPPGAVQHESEIDIRFTPAQPGRIYRLECSTGILRRRFGGQPVSRDALPPTSAEQRTARIKFSLLFAAVVGFAAIGYLVQRFVVAGS